MYAVSNKGHQLNSSINSDAIENRVNDITSIVYCFEKGIFFRTYEESLKQFFGVNIKRELDDLLLWLNSDFVPSFLNEVRKFDKKEIKQCQVKVVQIKAIFRHLCKFLNVELHNRSVKKHTFVCNTCEEVITPQTAHKDIWHNLEQHDHIEEALQRVFLPKGNHSDYITDTITNLPLVMDEINELSDLMQACSVSASTSDCSVANNVEPAVSKSSFESNQEILRKPSSSQNNVCSCCLAPNDCKNFKFNFPISYDSRILKKIYLPRHISNDVMNIDGLGQPTIQFKTPRLFTCLLCLQDVSSRWNSRLVYDHVNCIKHRKQKVIPCVINSVTAYHARWMQLEVKYQAHQIYFLPINITETLCTLCNTPVSYDSLEWHINKEPHKTKFLTRYSSVKEKSCIQDLQAMVYGIKEESLCDNLNTLEDTNARQENNIPKPAVKLKKKTVSEELADNDVLPEIEREEDSEQFVQNDERKKAVAELKKGGLLPEERPKIKPEVPQINEEQPLNKNKHKSHIVIKSVANEAGTELKDLLENRFLPHLKLFKKVNDNSLECQSCLIKVTNHPATVRDHICSKNHRTEAKTLFPYYQFYCDICDLIFKQNDRWKDHLKGTKHTEKCERLGASRKNKLTEYECNNCKLVIFGDNFSVKRHVASTGRGAWHRKNKEIILSAEVKTLFKTEQCIKERCVHLTKEANLVLRNQEPMLQCLRALEAALSDIYPDCKAFPFGSRVSGLGNMKSDLDVFMDVGGMYMGQRSQDARDQEKFVNTSCKAFRKKKDEFSHVNPIPTARTPIVQVYHTQTHLDCDLSFRHGLSVENTKFLRLCMEVQPVTQSLILLLKQWVEYCKLQEHITTYALSMMVIFFLQVMGYLMPIHKLRQLNPEEVLIIDGWGIVDFSNSIASMRDHVTPYNESMKELLKKFFSYYSSFNYTTDVICPLLGRPIKKVLFLDKPKGEDLPLEMLSYVVKVSNNDSEYFRARSPFCVQDPFDLSHNLVKACTLNVVEKLKTFCDLTFKYLTTNQ